MVFALEDVFFRSAIAASVLRCTSFTSSCCTSTGSVAEDGEVRISAFTERDDGERVSWRESELADGSIRGGLSAGNTAEPVLGSSVGGGEGEVRDCSLFTRKRPAGIGELGARG